MLVLCCVAVGETSFYAIQYYTIGTISTPYLLIFNDPSTLRMTLLLIILLIMRSEASIHYMPNISKSVPCPKYPSHHHTTHEEAKRSVFICSSYPYICRRTSRPTAFYILIYIRSTPVPTPCSLYLTANTEFEHFISTP